MYGNFLLFQDCISKKILVVLQASVNVKNCQEDDKLPTTN